jgi:uncharacterized membrane protein YsdA (DUF1294 family)
MIFPLLLIVYVLAINFYAFLFMKEQKNANAEEQKQADGKLSLIALLGGGITVFTCMFIFKNRLNNLFFMLAVPLLSALHICLWIMAIRACWGIFRF